MSNLRDELEQAREEREALGRALLGYIDYAREPHRLEVGPEPAKSEEDRGDDESWRAMLPPLASRKGGYEFHK